MHFQRFWMGMGNPSYKIHCELLQWGLWSRGDDANQSTRTLNTTATTNINK